RMYHELLVEGVPTQFDDRPKMSPGGKFTDAEPLGMPTIVIIGRNLGEGVVEVRERASGHRRDVHVDEAVTHVAALYPVTDRLGRAAGLDPQTPADGRPIAFE